MCKIHLIFHPCQSSRTFSRFEATDFFRVHSHFEIIFKREETFYLINYVKIKTDFLENGRQNSRKSRVLETKKNKKAVSSFFLNFT